MKNVAEGCTVLLIQIARRTGNRESLFLDFIVVYGNHLGREKEEPQLRQQADR